MSEWGKSSPVDNVKELQAASRLYSNPTFEDAAAELERLRAMADCFRDAAPKAYADFLAGYVLTQHARSEK